MTNPSKATQEDEDQGLFRLIYEQSAVGVCVFDFDGRVVRANPACCHLSGYSQSELCGKHWKELTHPDDIQAELPHLASLCKESIKTFTLRKRFLNRQNEAIPTEVVVSVLRDAEGAPYRFFSIVSDLREARRAEMELQAGEERFRSVVEHIPDGLARLSFDHRFLWMNSIMGSALGLDPDRCQGTGLSDLGVPADKLREWEDLLGQAIAQRQPVESETEWHERFYNLRVIPEAGSPGAAPTVLIVVRDVTANRVARRESLKRLLWAERLNEAGVALDHAGLDEQAALDVIARFASTFIGETCFITLISPDGRGLTAAAVHDPDPAMADWGWRLLKAAPFRADGPIFSKLLATGEPVNMAEVPAGYLRTVLRPEHQEIATGYNLHSLLIVPMRTSQRITGAVILIRATPGNPFTPEDQALIQELADRAALTLASAQLFRENCLQAEQLRQANDELEQRVAQRTAQLKAANEELQRLATHDPLTGVFNRRQFDLSLAKELGRSQRNRRWLSLLMLDIDYFKRYNDLYGHQAGDLCLQKIAQVMEACFRRSADLVARYGGEEFAVILPELEPLQARERAEQLVKTIAGQEIPHQGSDVAAWVTASVGIVTFRADPQCTAEWCIARADEALYASKAGGRNRVTFSQEQA